jgi:long-chain acyl-CoA synthetase
MSFFLKKKYLNKVALFSDKKKIKYVDIRNFIETYKNLFSKKNVIFLVCENNITCIQLYLLLFSCNSIIVMLDKNISQNKLLELKKIYKPKYILTNTEVVNYNLIFKRKIKEYFLYSNNNGVDEIETHYDIKLLMPTSGTTGSQKYVIQTKENLISNTESIIKYLKLNSKKITITNLPLNYVYGLSIVNTFLRSGASIFVTNESVTQKKFWTYLKKYKINFLNGVPYIYELLDRLNFFKTKNEIKSFTQAGGELNQIVKLKIINFCKKFKSKFYIMYGSTEATARMSYLNPNHLAKKFDSIGKAIPGGKMTIRNKHGKILTKNKVGNICYEGNNVTLGYCESVNDLTKKFIKKKYLITGDIGYRDKDNFFYIVRRDDRLIKLYGYRIDLDEIEKIFQKNGVKVVCFNNKNKKINLYFENNLEKDTITSIIKKNFSINMNMIKINSIKKFPINQNMKIIYDEEKFKSQI